MSEFINIEMTNMYITDDDRKDIVAWRELLSIKNKTVGQMITYDCLSFLLAAKLSACVKIHDENKINEPS